MKYLPRVVDSEIDELMEIMGTVLIEGCKWCGKSTTVFYHAKSINFGDMDLYEFAYILRGNVDIPLLSIRYDTMIDIEEIVDSQMDGNFYNYVKDITDDRKL